MPDALSNTRHELRKLTGRNVGHGRPATKAVKAKSMSEIAGHIKDPAAMAALSDNSSVELCSGAEDKPDNFLSWNGLAVEVISATADMLEDVQKGGRKKAAPVRVEYINCLRALVKHAPNGSIRAVVPSLMTRLIVWLRVEILRSSIAVEIWQLFRDVLMADENRAMVTPGILKNWAAACVEQILGTGCNYFKSDIATNFAHEAFVLLAKHAPTFDVLTQQHGKPSSEMQGLDFGYVILTEHCIQMIYVAKHNLKDRIAKQVQSTALKCIATILEKYTLDFTACSAANTILEHGVAAVLGLWTDRRYHEGAVEAANSLIRLAVCNRQEKMLEPIRERIEADFGAKDNAPSVVRNMENIFPAKIQAAGLLFALPDILEKVQQNNIAPIHLTVWLRVLTYTLQYNCNIYENEADVPVLGTRVVNAIRLLFSQKKLTAELPHSSSRSHSGKMPVYVLIDCCRVVRVVTEIVGRAVAEMGDGIMISEVSDSKDCKDPWARIYRCFLEQLVQIKYANSYKSNINRSRVNSSSATSTAEKPLMECLICILNSGLMDKSGLYSYVNSSAREKSFSWISIFSETNGTNTMLPEEAVLFARAHLSVTGIRDNASFRSILLRLMLSFCECARTTISLQNAVAVVLGLSRGVCPKAVDEFPQFDEIDTESLATKKSTEHSIAAIKKRIRDEKDKNSVVPPRNNIDAFMYQFCHANINSDISGNAYVRRLRAAMLVSGKETDRDLFIRPTHILNGNNNNNNNNNTSDVAYFNVDASVTNNIEREFMALILGALDGLMDNADNNGNTDDSGNNNDNEDSSPWIFDDDNDDAASPDSTSFAEKFKNRYGMFSDTEIDNPLERYSSSFVRIAFLIATYLEQGVSYGVIRCEELDGDKGIARMLVVLILLLKKLSKTTELRFLEYSPVSTTLSCLISASSSLHAHWRESRSGPSTGTGQSEVENVDEKPITHLADLLSIIVGNVAQGLCSRIEKATHGVVGKIKSLNSTGQPARGMKRTRNGNGNAAQPTRKRKRTVLKSIPKKKALAWSDDESQSDEDRTDGNEDDGDESDASKADSNGFDDEENAPFEPIGTPPGSPTPKDTMFIESKNLVRSLAQILISVQKFPQLKEVVFDQCKSCLQRLKHIEQRLGEEDARNQALMASGTVSRDYLSVRSYLWEVFFHDEYDNAAGSPVDVAAVKDVIHFGEKWKIIEDQAVEVVEYYFDVLQSNTRKHYASLTCHEHLRHLFLRFGSRALRSFSRCSSHSDNYNNSNSGAFEFDSALLSSLIGIHDTFRKRDGFHMPRSTRAVFAYFSVELLHCLMPRPMSSQDTEIMTDVDNPLTKPSQSIRDMLCKLLSDADASVRIAVAGSFRVFSNLTEAMSSNASNSAERSLFEAFRTNEPSMDAESNNPAAISWKKWKLSDRDESELHKIREGFEMAGKSSRAISNLVMLAEVGMESPKHLPVCLFEILSRVADDSKIEEYAFNIMIRLCGTISIEGPQELFAVVERILLQKWFSSFRGFAGLKRFPVKLVHDANRNKGGVLYDWMREYTAQLLPFMLLSDQDSGDLKNTKKYCTALGFTLEGMFEAYVGPMSRVFPMMFTAGYDMKGSNLWSAIDEALDGQAGTLLKRNEEDTFVSLLTSISTRDVTQNSADAPAAFLRDCSGINPPFYDPAVIMTALQSLCTKESTATKVLSRRTMKGALFDSSMHESEEESEKMSDIVKKFCGSSAEILPGALTSIILAVWKMLCGPPSPVHPQNRIDAFLIVGTLWKIVGDKILEDRKRRRLFLKLLLQGFRFPETALNALWLFKIFTRLTISRNSAADVDMVDRDDAKGIADSEIEYFQLLSASIPMLVDLSVAKNETPSKSAALDAVKQLVETGWNRRMWASLAAIDLVPNIDEFKEVRRLQDKAWKSSVEQNEPEMPIRREMKAFVASEARAAREENRHIVLTVSKLKRLRSALVEENRAFITKTIQEESWLRSEGLPEDMLGLLNDVLGHLIDLTFEMSLLTSRSYSQGTHTSIGSDLSNSENSPHGVVQECTWLIGMLGTIHPTSLVFESRKRRQDERIKAATEPDRYKKYYEESKHGILKAMPALQMLFFGDSPLVARVAFSSLVAVMGSSKGKELYNIKDSPLVPFKEFRVIARKKGINETRNESDGFFDYTTGSRLEPDFLETTDEALWTVPRDWLNNESPGNRWVRQIAATIANNSETSAFNQVSASCFVSAHFSRMILPYLLMDHMEGKTKDNPTCPVLSKVIVDHIFSDVTVPLEAVRMVVHALDTCCQMEMATQRKKGVGGIFDNSKIEHLRLYRLDIPYLVVADAAARVGMYFSAIRYASLHVDYESINEERITSTKKAKSSRGSSRRSSSVSPKVNLRENARKSVEHILALAADNINEPDMKRALGRDGDLLTTASQMAVLDSNWGRSVGTLDALCNQPNGSSPDDSQDISMEQNAELPLKQELMLVKSMNGLGCTYLVSQYWENLRQKNIRQEASNLNAGSSTSIQYLELVDELNELRYAAAWKLGDWEVPGVIVPVSRGRHLKKVVGHHQTIHKALAALATGDSNAMLNSLQAGRESQAVWFGRMDTSESAHRLYEMAGRVRVLNKIESVINVVTSGEEVNHYDPSDGSTTRGQFVGSSRMLSDSQSDNVLRLLGGNAEISTLGFGHGGWDMESSSTRDFTFDLQNSIARCIGSPSIVARVSANVAGDILARGGSGSWARAAAALGTESSVQLNCASSIDAVSWKLQGARLRWSASSEGRTKQRALSDVRALILKDLGGYIGEMSRNSIPLRWNNIGGNDDGLVALVRAKACQLVASWSAEIRAEEPVTLFASYLQLGLMASESMKSTPQIGSVHYFMAKFADSQITSIDNYRKTKNYSQMVDTIADMEKRLAKYKKVNKDKLFKGRTKIEKAKLEKDLSILIRTTNKHIMQDRERLAILQSKYKHWQLMACRHYACALRNSIDKYLRSSFRLVALWLDSGEMRNKITSDLNQAENTYTAIDVPVAKLLPLFPQMSSRLGGTVNDAFQKSLSATLEKMSREFPNHCLWQLLALSNSTRESGTDEKLTSFYRGDKDKKERADSILARLHTKGSNTIRQMKKVADAYIKLSEIGKAEKHERTSLNIHKSDLCRLDESEIDKVTVPTMGLPMYGFSDSSFQPPHITRFEKIAKICNGLSKPLAVICWGSDGHKYSQLVKGRDDLRGDAVMEQMFTIFNELLRRDPSASQRNLVVRTYRIVPLSPFSGIMQFVTNTDSFNSILIEGGKKSLHERYRPHDWTHAKMQNGSFSNGVTKNSIRLRMDWLQLNWGRIQPVFRYFFLERWPDPVDWFTRQLAYTRSAAVMSIVGFVLGIGDRHLSNVLLDTAKGEIVHIDFGVAFEQGKLLPTPEHMPFRLSRDFVDGFGISGVDGTFRRCCEVTLEVLRRNKDVLLTVIEVLLHDPMYSWALTPERILKEQLGEEEGNKMETTDLFGELEKEGSTGESSSNKESGSEQAQRALRRIAEKLDGLEDTERLSVQAHVARLIDEARSFPVLASVYPGWAPWV